MRSPEEREAKRAARKENKNPEHGYIHSIRIVTREVLCELKQHVVFEFNRDGVDPEFREAIRKNSWKKDKTHNLTVEQPIQTELTQTQQVDTPASQDNPLMHEGRGEVQPNGAIYYFKEPGDVNELRQEPTVGKASQASIGNQEQGFQSGYQRHNTHKKTK